MSLFNMRYQQEKQIACRDLQSGSQVYETASGLVEGACIGNGPAVLISHGSSGGYDMGIWLAKLIGSGFHYIAPSRFGYLRTPVPANPTPERQADTYAVLLNALNINSSLVIGLSAGGPSALQLVFRYPERCRGLIMLSAISGPLPPLPFVLRMIYPFMLRSDFIPWFIYTISPDFIYRSNGVNRKLLSRIKHDPEKMRLLETLFQTSFPTSLRRDGIVNDMQQGAILPPNVIEHIVTPTLVVHAINDPIVPFGLGEYTAQSIPGALFLRLEQGGHFCTVTHREEVVPIMREFLDRYAS